MSQKELLNEILWLLDSNKLEKRGLGGILGSEGNDISKIGMANRFIDKLREGRAKERDVVVVSQELSKISQSITVTATGNSVNIGSIKGDESGGLSAQQFMDLDEQQRTDYLKFLELTKR